MAPVLRFLSITLACSTFSAFAAPDSSDSALHPHANKRGHIDTLLDGKAALTNAQRFKRGLPPKKPKRMFGSRAFSARLCVRARVSWLNEFSGAFRPRRQRRVRGSSVRGRDNVLTYFVVRTANGGVILVTNSNGIYMGVVSKTATANGQYTLDATSTSPLLVNITSDGVTPTTMTQTVGRPPVLASRILTIGVVEWHRQLSVRRSYQGR